MNMKKILLIGLIWVSWIWAADCTEKLFSFDTTDSGSVRIYDIASELADTCRFSLLYKDKEVKRQIRQSLGIVHIKDYTLKDMFKFLFADHNIFYHYDPEKRILELSYIQTRSFHIDYVNLSQMKTESVKSITVGTSDLSTGGESGTSGVGGVGGGASGSYGTGSTTGSGDNTDMTTVLTVTEFKFWDHFKAQIDAILQRDEDSHAVHSKALVNREAGIVTVTGTRRQIERVARYIRQISDRLHKQVLLEANLIELRYADQNSTGIDWSRFDMRFRGIARKGGTFLLRDGYRLGYQFTMDGLLQFLQKYGDVHTISNPKVMTLNNQPAVINVGDQINYRYQTGSVSNYNNGASATNTYELGSMFVGLTLIVVPEVTDDGFVILRVNPVISERLDDSGLIVYPDYPDEKSDYESILKPKEQSTDRSMPPDVKIKQLTSIVKVKNGNKVVIGGLISKRLIHDNNAVPILSDIPILGRAFHHTETKAQKVELIVVITPHIVDGSGMPSIDDALKAIK